jgi:hypothetical protein
MRFRKKPGAPHLARFSRDVGYHSAKPLTLNLKQMSKGSGRVPHVPEFPVKSRGFRTLHVPFLKGRRIRNLVQGRFQEIRGVRPTCPTCPDLPWGVRGPKTMGDPDFLPRRATSAHWCGSHRREPHGVRQRQQGPLEIRGKPNNRSPSFIIGPP